MPEDRIIDPNLRFVQLFMDELHWVELSAEAAERRVSIDKLVGCIMETVLINLGRIKPGEGLGVPVGLDVTLEPIRTDKPFLQALLDERENHDRDREVAKNVTEADLYPFDWKDL